MRLGTWIETLEALPQDAGVVFDNGMRPTRLVSWRGVYAELTLDSDLTGEPLTVAALLADARAALTKTFTGYKGGDYDMDASTPVWGDGYGDCTYLALGGVTVSGDVVTIETHDTSDYRAWGF